MPTPTAIEAADTNPEFDPCLVRARRLGAVREDVIGSIVTGRSDHVGLMVLTQSSDARVLHRWYISGPDVAYAEVPTIEPIVLPHELVGFGIRRRIEFAASDSLLFELVSPSLGRVLLEVPALPLAIRVHHAPDGEALGAGRHGSSGLIHVSTDEGNLYLTTPDARVLVHESSDRGTQYAANLEPFAGGHLLAATSIESSQNLFLVARFDGAGAIVWQQILGRHPATSGRRKDVWQHDALGAPVMALDSERLVVAFGTNRIFVRALDPATGATLEDAASMTVYDRQDDAIAWIPLSIRGVSDHHQLVARSCVHGQDMCGLTSLKWVDEDMLPQPLLKLWFSETSFPAVHDWTDHREVRLVLATREWADDTTNWWIIDLPDSCEADREPGTIPYKREFRLPY